jgi:(4S)-4-hydroxy-5-phosphonooxypentane-2,3-dione isomerase
MRNQANTSLQEEEGCLQFDVCVDPNHDHILFLYEVYQSRVAFQSHLDSTHFAHFDQTVQPWIESKHIAAYNRLSLCQE